MKRSKQVSDKWNGKERKRQSNTDRQIDRQQWRQCSGITLPFEILLLLLLLLLLLFSQTNILSYSFTKFAIVLPYLLYFFHNNTLSLSLSHARFLHSLSLVPGPSFNVSQLARKQALKSQNRTKLQNNQMSFEVKRETSAEKVKERVISKKVSEREREIFLSDNRKRRRENMASMNSLEIDRERERQKPHVSLG